MSAEIYLSRFKLYGMVWTTPISRLAADLGISDVGLRKACVRHDIPVPARGHWARLAAGQKVETPALPRPGDDDVVALYPFDYLDYCRTNGTFRKERIPVPSRAQALKDAAALRSSPEWRAIKWAAQGEGGSYSASEELVWRFVSSQAETIDAVAE